jgi:threonine/homoserine/homoserine lactone efflux protein
MTIDVIGFTLALVLSAAWAACCLLVEPRIEKWIRRKRASWLLRRQARRWRSN